MRVHLKRPVLVWTLLLIILWVSGFMAAPSVGHTEHHAGHQAATHSTGICAWMCAAGDGIESFAFQLSSNLQLIERTIIVPSTVVRSAGSFSYFLRGPPVSFS